MDIENTAKPTTPEEEYAQLKIDAGFDRPNTAIRVMFVGDGCWMTYIVVLMGERDFRLVGIDTFNRFCNQSFSSQSAALDYIANAPEVLRHFLIEDVVVTASSKTKPNRRNKNSTTGSTIASAPVERQG